MGPPILCADTARRSAPNCLDIERHLAKRLHRIDMQQAARGVRHVGRLAHRLDHAGLVVGRHQGHQRRSRALGGRRRKPRLQVADRRHAVAARRRNARPAGNRRPPAPRRARCRRRSRRRSSRCRRARSIRLSASAFASEPPEVKITLRGSAPTARRDLLARLLQDAPGRAPLGMHRRRVPDGVHGRSHGGARLRTQRRGRIPVEIDPFRHGSGCLGRLIGPILPRTAGLAKRF